MSCPRTPRGIASVLRAVLPPAYAEDVVADLRRGLKKREEQGWSRPRIWAWCWSQVLRSDTLRLARLLRTREKREESGEGGGMVVESLARDLRFAWRGMWRSPSFALAAVAALSVGIGANVAVFSMVRGVLLKPLPYPQPERLAYVWMIDKADNDSRLPWPLPTLKDVVSANGSFTSFVGYSAQTLTLTGLGDPELIQGTLLTSGILDAFGEKPALGRDLRADEAAMGAQRTVVISHRFWQERFGGDPSVLGRTLTLSTEPYEIVGVAPEGFDYPRESQLWVPGQWDPGIYHRNAHFLSAVGRLAPGATLVSAGVELTGISSQLAQAHPDTDLDLGIRLDSLIDETVGPVRVGLYLLMAAVALVLLIACANVANLLLTRGALRRGEMMVRTTLGATRWALVRMLVSESFVLSATSTALGTLLGVWGIHGLRAWIPTGMPRVNDIAVDGMVLALAAGLGLVVTVLQGVVPAWRVTRLSAADNPREGTTEGTRTTERGLGRSGIMAAEMAISLVLMIGAGLLLRSFGQVSSVDLGFAPEGVTEFNVAVPTATYNADESAAFFQALEDRLRALQGTEAVGAINGSPLGQHNRKRTYTLVGGREAKRRDQEEWVFLRSVTPGYLEAMRIPLLKGRWFDAGDRAGSTLVAVISRRTAERMWPNEDPIGRQFEFHEGVGDGPWTIVGVVGDIRSQQLTVGPAQEAYFPESQWARNTMTVMLRSHLDGAGLETAIRREVKALDPGLAVYGMERFDDHIDALRGPERFYLLLLAAFAVTASGLACLGLYGVISYLVSRRTREIGIRVALGASRWDVVRLVARQGAPSVLLGIVTGLGAALLCARFIRSLLYQVDPWDPVACVLAAGVLAAVAILATVLPARRAARIPPTEAIRSV